MNCTICYARATEAILLRFISPSCLSRQVRGHRTAAWSPNKLRRKGVRPIAPVDLPELDEQRFRRNESALENSEPALALRRNRQHNKQPWQIQKEALKRKLKNESWSSLKRLSPDALDGIRVMHSQFPDKFTTPVLAEYFKVSPEVIRRVLKSKWTPSEEETESRRLRWERRGQKIWAERAEKGLKPPAKWRRMGIGKLGHDEKPHKKLATTTNAGKPGIRVHSGITARRVTDYGDRHTREHSGNGVSYLEKKSLGERIL